MARMCPECNSTRLTKEGWKKLKDGNKQRWRCKVCNNLFYKPKWTRGKKKDTSKQPSNETTIVVDNDTEKKYD